MQTIAYVALDHHDTLHDTRIHHTHTAVSWDTNLKADHVFSHSLEQGQKTALGIEPGISLQLLALWLHRLDDSGYAELIVAFHTVKCANDQIDNAEMETALVGVLQHPYTIGCKCKMQHLSLISSPCKLVQWYCMLLRGRIWQQAVTALSIMILHMAADMLMFCHGKRVLTPSVLPAEACWQAP